MSFTYAYDIPIISYTNTISAGIPIRGLHFSEINTGVNNTESNTEISPTTFDVNTGVIRTKYLNDLINSDNAIRAKLNLAWHSFGQSGTGNTPASPSGLSQVIPGQLIRKVHLSDVNLGIRNKLDDTRTKIAIKVISDDGLTGYYPLEQILYNPNEVGPTTDLSGPDLNHPYLYNTSITTLSQFQVKLEFSANSVTSDTGWLSYNNMTSSTLSGWQTNYYARTGLTGNRIQWYVDLFLLTHPVVTSLHNYVTIHIKYRHIRSSAPAEGAQLSIAWTKCYTKWTRDSSII